TVGAHDHDWDGDFTVVKAATLLADGVKVEHCTVCGMDRPAAAEFEPDVRTFTSSTTGSYSPISASIGTIRGNKHFYEAGNDLLIEYSFLWNESTLNLRGDKNPFIDTRFIDTNIIYWSPVSGISYSDCQYPGGFEYGGIDLDMPDNPYPGFNSGANGTDDNTVYPNIGGYNNGGGTEQTNDLYGWHRVSIRYRNELTNKDALMADGTPGATPATYNLEMWVYVDGVLVIHAYQTDLSKESEDRKLFSAESDGNGGIVYTENDSLILKPVYLNSKQATGGKNVYYSVADINVTVGTDFVQNVRRVNSPAPATLEVETGVFVTSTMWYELDD
ncbi:MAG: hypothetical protein J6Z13_00320, partial [Clostridia bacterium]|nr:hypothetical protein [Clostridia bacterium]